VQLAPHFDANGGNFEKTLEGLDAMLDAGATMLEALPLLFCKGPQDLPKFYERLAKVKIG
jgi:hypothetical protein